MLVLTRAPLEKLIIGKPGDVLTEPIVISVQGVGLKTARLGITAQRNVCVMRDELVNAGADALKPAPLMTTKTKELAD